MYIAGLVIAILGLVIGLIPLFGWFALPLNLTAVIIGIIGVRRKEEIEKGEYQMAMGTLILGAIPLVLKILNIAGLMALGASA